MGAGQGGGRLILVGTEAAELLQKRGADFVRARLDGVEFSVAPDQRNDAVPAREHPAHRRGLVAVRVVLFAVGGKQRLIRCEALVDECLVDDLQIADHPAAILERPEIGKPHQLVVARDVGEERKPATRHRAVVALAMPRPLAFHRHAVFVQALDDFFTSRVGGVVLAPQIAAPAQQLPLPAIDDRHGMFGRAAHGRAAVMRRAFRPAIEARHGGLELGVNLAVELSRKCHGANTIGGCREAGNLFSTGFCVYMFRYDLQGPARLGAGRLF